MNSTVEISDKLNSSFQFSFYFIRNFRNVEEKKKETLRGGLDTSYEKLKQSGNFQGILGVKERFGGQFEASVEADIRETCKRRQWGLRKLFAL